MPNNELAAWAVSLDRPLIIAHRGASAYYPENTLPAIEEAIRMGADMVEVDVQLTADQVPVIAHDYNTARTSVNRGYISQMQWKELQHLDVGSWFHSRFSDARIPILDQVLDLCKNKLPINLEVKCRERNPEKLRERLAILINFVAEHQMENSVLFSGFDSRVSDIVKSLNSHIATAVLYSPLRWKRILPSRLTRNFHADFFHCSWRQHGKRWQEDLDTYNIPVNVYTVNQISTYSRMKALGVTGVFTDRPDVLRKYENSD